MKRVLQGLALLLAALAAVCLINVWRLPAVAPPAAPVPALALDGAAAAARLAAALRIPTISYEDRERTDPAAFAALAALLRDSFPRVHAAMRVEPVGASLLYTWAGREAALPPALLLAHLDVVPVEPGTETRWTHPPFGGVIADGAIWGRGARDDKSGVLALLEAAERLLADGFQPARTVYFAFGHDEEIGGTEGARRIAALLRERGVRAAFLLDEGGAVLEGLVPGVTRPVASIMTAEKGYLTARLTARGEGGHSSQPPPQTAVGRLARAVARIQAAPLPARLVPPATGMLDDLAPAMPFALRLVVANRWLFGPLLERRLAAVPASNALIRTTTAPTMFHAGIKDNVLPMEAEALINFRLLPGDTRASVLQRLGDIVDDADIAIAEAHPDFNSEPSAVSPTDHPAYRRLARVAREVFPDAVVSTGLVIGATDARHYDAVAETRYNFSPARLTPADLRAIHGTDERIDVDNYLSMIRFYARLLQALDAP